MWCRLRQGSFPKAIGAELAIFAIDAFDVVRGSHYAAPIEAMAQPQRVPQFVDGFLR